MDNPTCRNSQLLAWCVDWFCVLHDAVPLTGPHPSVSQGSSRPAMMVLGPAFAVQGVDVTKVRVVIEFLDLPVTIARLKVAAQ